MEEKKNKGRKKGALNKSTVFSKLIITNILSDYQATGLMDEDIALLQPKERLAMMIKLMEFVTPKPQSVDMNINAEKHITIEDTLLMLAEANE